MLKLIYTDSGFYLEHLLQSLEAFVACRSVLALRLGQSFHMETGRAAFLLPSDLPILSELERVLIQEPGSAVKLSPIDARFVEVSVKGMWIATDAFAHEGIFVAALSDRLESLLERLWQMSQTQLTFLF